MSVELERAYTKLAENVDTQSIPTLPGVLARGRQRRRRSMAGTAALTALALFAAAQLLPASGTPHPTSPFVTLTGKPAPAISFDKPPYLVVTLTDERRSYFLWETETEQFLVVVDVETGKRLWEPVSLGQASSTGFLVVGDVILAPGVLEHGAARTDEDRSLKAIDANNGQLMWSQPYRPFEDYLVYHDTLVLHRERAGEIHGIDMRTGKSRWTRHDPIVEHGGLLPLQDSGEITLFDGRLAPSVHSGSQFVMRLASGKVQLRDLATGDLARELDGPVPVPDSGDDRRFEYVIDEVFYRLEPTTLLRLPLDGSPSQTFPVSLRPNGPGVPCGKARLCMLTSNSPVMLDLDTGRELWRSPERATGGVLAFTGSHLLIQSGGDGKKLYDLQGRALMEFPKVLAPLWMDPDTVFLPYETELHVYRLGKREQVKLAGFELAEWANGCSWNSTMLACPADDGIYVWRYRVR